MSVAKTNGSGALFYILKDHLGSIQYIRSEDGLTTEELSFDAWGRRRNPADYNDFDVAASNYLNRGFTGHEHLDAFGLIDMNGRVYDPILGRFLSPDPYVQLPGFTQSFNRYSYCLNNPLIFTDPSGEAAWMLWPVSWAGNWLIGGLDRWINGKQSFKQSFSPMNNPVVIGGNYSPSDNKFSNYQVDAFKAARHEELVSQQMDDFVASQSGRGGDGNALYAIGMGLNAAGFVTSAGEYSNIINGSWRGVNGKWNSLEWGGNKWTGARSNAISRAGAFKLASRGFFVVGTGISLYQGGDAFLKGDYNGAAKSGLDIGMGAYATFGGPPGWIIGGGYFGLDALGAFNRPFITTPYTPFYYAVPDNTYVSPSIIRYP